MKIASQYILRQTLWPLGAAMVIGLMVLLAERMVRLLEVTLGKKNSFGIVFELLGYLVPHYLGFALPAALFLGLLFGFNRMSKDSEIDAFLAAGIGLHRLTVPVLMLAGGLTAASIAIFGWLQPHTRYAYRAVLHTVINVEIFYLAEEGVFMQTGPRTFILDKLARDSNRFERIFLFDERGPQGSETVTASEGSLVQVPGESRPVLRLEGGHRLKVEGQPFAAPQAALPRFVVGDFARADTPLGRVANLNFRARGLDERELTLTELVARRASPPEKSTPDAMRAELHRRLVNILTVPVLPILAIPFALGRRRGQRAYRFGVALVLLVAYNEIIEQGALAVRANGTSPWLAVWLPFALLVAFSAWRFYRACFVLRPDRLEAVIERVNDALGWARARLAAVAGAR